MNRSAMFRGAVAGGVVAATIDIGAACLISGKSVGFILQFIAGGLLARQTFEGGTSTMLLGFVLQLLMGVIIAVIYGLAAVRNTQLQRNWLTWGLLYGVVIFVVMNYVVLPLSAWHRIPHFEMSGFVQNMAAMLLFGVIVVYATQRSMRSGHR